MKKIANSCIYGPILRAVLKNRGSADRPTMDRFVNFLTFSHTKPELKGGLFNEKNCQLWYFGPHIVGRFGHIGGSANRATIDRFEKF